MLTEKDLEMIKSEMEKGSPIPKVLREKDIDAEVPEVRTRLFEKYGKEEIQKIVQEKIMPNMRDAVGQQFSRIIERILSRPRITGEEIDSIVAQLQDSIVKLNAKKAELK
jgi:hypothetical protein